MLGIGLFKLIPVEESGALNGLGTVSLGIALLRAGAAEAAAETTAEAAAETTAGHSAALGELGKSDNSGQRGQRRCDDKGGT